MERRRLYKIAGTLDASRQKTNQGEKLFQKMDDHIVKAREDGN